MALMEWKAEYSVGVAEIDKQHQRLFELINTLFDAMRDGKGYAVLDEVLKGLVEYTKTHFAYEEKYFDEFHFELVQSHKLAHSTFVKKIASFEEEFEKGDSTITIELINFLKEWLVGHIQGTDRKYIDCFHEHGLK